MLAGSVLAWLMVALLLFSALEEEVGGVLSISRSDCGTSKLCEETPTSCDPSSSSGSCLFISAAATPTDLSLSLRGDLPGYIAVGLTNSSKDEGMSSLFVCAQNGSHVFFRTVQRNNSAPDAPFTDLQMPVSNFSGELNGSVIRCTFSVPLVNLSSLKTNQDTVFALLLGTGAVNGSSLKAFNISLRTEPVDLVKNTTVAPPTTTTTAPPTAPPTTTTTAPPTATTTAPPTATTTTTTTAPPTAPPTTLSISRSDCGTSKLCVETPSSCDPSSSSGSCLFSSAAVAATNISFSLRGDSSGYIALGLTSNASQEISKFFVCGKRSNSFFFETAEKNNSLQNASLTRSNMSVQEVKGEVNGTVIKCVFRVQSADLRGTRSSDVVFAVTLGTGTVNGTDLGSLKEDLKTVPLDLSDPKATVAPPTVAPTSTPVPGRAVCPSALLSALTLPVLLTLAVMK